MEVTSKAQRRTPKEIETFRINRLAVLRFYLSSNFIHNYTFYKISKTLEEGQNFVH